ncbi:MAG: hypothetical protein HQK83_18390, partial [Fibrobacteria bacterium]|nr:hypothetical protein [Fibrobacteria bacterium]
HQYFLEKFVKKILATTAHHDNVMYEIFNEGEWYNQTNFRKFQVHFLAVAKAKTDKLLMINDDHVAGADFWGESNCDVISLHKPNWSATTPASSSFNHFAPDFSKTPTKPVFFSEPVPEYRGDPAMFDGNLRLMWGTLMAGAGFVVQNDASWGFTEKAAISDKMSENLKVLKAEGACARFFNESGIDFSDMSPQGSLASTGICLAEPGMAYLVYSESGASFTVNLSAVSGNINARFYDPRTGEFKDSFSVMGGSSTESFTKPSSSDWVLHIGDAIVDVKKEVQHELRVQNLKAYSLPLKNRVEIEVTGRVESLGVFNLTGRQVWSFSPAQGLHSESAVSRFTWKTDRYSNGTYFITAKTESGNFITKLVLQK